MFTIGRPLHPDRDVCHCTGCLEYARRLKIARDAYHARIAEARDREARAREERRRGAYRRMLARFYPEAAEAEERDSILGVRAVSFRFNAPALQTYDVLSGPLASILAAPSAPAGTVQGGAA